MTTVSQIFLDRWRTSDAQVGGASPQMYVEVRLGRFFRDFLPWTFPETNFPRPDYVIIPSSPANQHGKPWQATWTPQGPWLTLPGVSQVTTDKDVFANNGIGTAQVTVENTRLQFIIGSLGNYHIPDRGYLTPFRDNNTLPPIPAGTVYLNQFIGLLIRNAQIRIWQGYGTDEMVPTFVGLIDDVEFDAGPNGDQAILTCRNFGRMFTDSRLFGWNKDPTLNDPIYFADRGWVNSPGSNAGPWWIQVDDISDIVRLICRWAGFKHWIIRDTNQGLNPGQPLMFDRSHFYADVISTICQMTGFIFFVGDPDPNDPESLGIPCFRYPRNLEDLPASEVLIVHDLHLLTGVQATVSDTDRAYIIRVRGKIPTIRNAQGYPTAITTPTQIDAQMAQDQNITTLGGDLSLRPTAVYRPPWTINNEQAGILKHVTHTDDYLVTYGDCLTACFLIAADEATHSYTATATCPGNPAIGLDTHVSIFDHGTGIISRVWVMNVKTSFTWGVDQESSGQLLWTTTFNGSLLDAPDMVAIKAELSKANINNQPLIPGRTILPYQEPIALGGGLLGFGAVPSGVPTTGGSGSSGPTPNAAITVGALLFNENFDGIDASSGLSYGPNAYGGAIGPWVNPRWVPATNVNNGVVSTAHCYVSGGMLNLVQTAGHGAFLSGRALDGAANEFKFIHGYFEYRAFIPGVGNNPYNWPALWAVGPNWPDGGEIDVFEGLAQATLNLHYGANLQTGPTNIAGTWCNGFHKYGAHWYASGANEVVDYYWDNVLVATQSGPIIDISDGMRLILNTGDGGGGTFHDTTSAPMQVDYVRVWSP